MWGGSWVGTCGVRYTQNFEILPSRSRSPAHQSPNPKFPNSSRRSNPSSPAAIFHHRRRAAAIVHHFTPGDGHLSSSPASIFHHHRRAAGIFHHIPASFYHVRNTNILSVNGVGY
ncbi:hypothetical protein Hanom_Chr07g00612301 [Helianthus anomalus]